MIFMPRLPWLLLVVDMCHVSVSVSVVKVASAVLRASSPVVCNLNVFLLMKTVISDVSCTSYVDNSDHSVSSSDICTLRDC